MEALLLVFFPYNPGKEAKVGQAGYELTDRTCLSALLLAPATDEPDDQGDETRG